MIAYSENDLYNCYVASEARQAFEDYEIDEESFLKIRKVYSCQLYTPSFFIAVAMGLVTIIAVSFTAALILLMLKIESSMALSLLSICMLIISYLVLELIVNTKKFYNAGIDNVLMILILVFSAGIFIYSESPSWILMNGSLMMVSLWLFLRFGDAFMARVSCSFLLITFYVSFLKLGDFAIETFPFAMMLIIAVLYFFIRKIKSKINFVYASSLEQVHNFLLIAFYASGNYWVVDELRSLLTHVPQPILLSWFFWIFTFVVPFLIIIYGILKKDLIKVRVGILLVIAAIFTYKYYFVLLPIEIEMLIAGVILIVLSFYLIKFLQNARYGFTSANTHSRPNWENAQALVIAQTMGKLTNSPNDSSLMNGGSGGGGGASSEF